MTFFCIVWSCVCLCARSRFCFWLYVCLGFSLSLSFCLPLLLSVVQSLYLSLSCCTPTTRYPLHSHWYDPLTFLLCLLLLFRYVPALSAFNKIRKKTTTLISQAEKSETNRMHETKQCHLVGYFIFSFPSLSKCVVSSALINRVLPILSFSSIPCSRCVFRL